MNLLLINYEFPPLGAGASTATWHMGKELSSMGHNTVILTSAFKGEKGCSFEEGMTVFRCPAIRKKESESNILEMFSYVFSAFFFLPWIIFKHKIEGIIVFFSFPCGPLGLCANLLFNIPYVISLRGGDVPGTDRSLDRIHKILKPIRRLIYGKSLAIIANSNGLREFAKKADPFEVSTIFNGIDTEYFQPADHQFKKNLFSFIFVGRLSTQKNIHFLLEQIEKLRKKTEIPFNLKLVGDGPLKDELRSYAKTLGISDIIKWHGWLDKNNILKQLQNSDCLINPSFCEGMPNAVLEAMACGVPVIASNVAGNNSLVIDGKNGFLFDLNDKNELLSKLTEAVNEPDKQKQMGKNARRFVVSKYSWISTADNYSRLFN